MEEAIEICGILVPESLVWMAGAFGVLVFLGFIVSLGASRSRRRCY